MLCKKLTVLLVYCVGCCALFQNRRQAFPVCFLSYFVSSSQPYELASITLPILQMSKLRLIEAKQCLCHHRGWSWDTHSSGLTPDLGCSFLSWALYTSAQGQVLSRAVDEIDH